MFLENGLDWKKEGVCRGKSGQPCAFLSGQQMVAGKPLERFSKCAQSRAFLSENWLDVVGVCAGFVFQRHSFMMLYEEQVVPGSLCLGSEVGSPNSIHNPGPTKGGGLSR